MSLNRVVLFLILLSMSQLLEAMDRWVYFEGSWGLVITIDGKERFYPIPKNVKDKIKSGEIPQKRIKKLMV